MILTIHYPNYETKKEIVITSTFVGCLIYLFLIIYQPFGTSQFEHSYKYLMLFPYAIITTFSFFIVSLFLTKRARKWTIGLELVKIFWILLLISTLSYIYNSLMLSKVNLSFENYLYMFLYTSALGLPASTIYIMARYIYLNKNKETISIDNTSSVTTTSSIDIKEGKGKLYIIADQGNTHLHIEEQDFVYAEAADNYCIIHFYRNGSVQKEIIRLSLTTLLNQIQTDTIKRVHRSFIVNLQMITKYKGNASGYKISVKNFEKELIVSRNYTAAIVPILKTVVARP